MDAEDGQKILGNQTVLSWAQLTAFVDPMMVLNDEQDRVVQEVRVHAEEHGLTIEQMDVTVEIRVQARAR